MTTRATRSEPRRLLGFLGILLLAAPPALAQSPPPDAPLEQLPPVVVIDSTPVPALGTPIDKYAGNVQTMPARDDRQPEPARRLRARSTATSAPSTSTHNQGNPWQSDLTYRGFLASPLAGSPVGLSHVSGRHALQRRVRRDHQLGPDPPVGHRGHRHHPRLEPDLRAEHARRRAGRAHQARLRLPGRQARGLGRLVRAVGRQRRVRWLPRSLRLLRELQHPERRRLARALAERPEPGLRQGRLQDEPHRPRGELHVRRQRADRHRPGAGEPPGSRPAGGVHVPGPH